MDKYLLLMYDRPTEPLFVPKGDERITFDIPPEYLLEKYQPVATRIFNRFSSETQVTVPVKQIAIPDLSVPLSISRHEPFSLHIPAHQKASAYQIKLFLGMRTVEDLISLAAYCRDRVNAQMFIYCLSVAILHRPDTKHLSLPQLHETPIEIPLDWTATNVDPEHKVAYWREDVGVNLHHWHWHLIYPFSGPQELVAKDRRGELFYYYHHQMMARYNTERLCNGLGRKLPLTNLREPLVDGYYPKLDSTVAGRAWPSRSPNLKPSDVNRESDGLTVSISRIERARDAIFEAIRTRQVRDSQDKIIHLDDKNGIDILGNVVESSILSPNQALYGDLHNDGHIVLSSVHDPDNRFLERLGIMGDNATAMRDPIFYAWHQFADDIFYKLLDSFTPYTTQQLNFPGVSVKNIRINTPNLNPNTLSTHWTKSDVELSRGLDFFPRGSVLARIQHLNYEEFTYTFLVNNNSNRELIGTLRVFIAPKLDEKGQVLSFNEQRKLMIEMDKFTARLGRGENAIVRKSTESSLTVPFEVTFRDLNDRKGQSFTEFNYCGCGWPQHMLVPRGTTKGYPMDLFFMVSDYELDEVNQERPEGCTNSVSFCGLKDLKYPDTRAMGFPFDRKARQGVKMLKDFVTSNMKMQPITIRFNDIIKPRQRSTTHEQE